MVARLAALSDEDLMLRCRGETPEQARLLVGELASRWLERLAGFIFGFTGDAAGAPDLAQEAFVRVFKHRENYREVARFSTWLYTIGRNLALNEIRNRKRRPNLVGADAEGRDDPLVRFADDNAGPAERTEQDDLRALVRREIGALPDHYRVVVILVDLEERPYQEAAEILELPIGTVRSRLSRAREQLERRLRKVL